MKKTFLTLMIFLISGNVWTDIGPNPIVVKSILAPPACEIQMVSETVQVELYRDSSRVSCVFHLKNFADSTTIPVGFPVMDFFHWNIPPYNSTDMNHFQISVDNIKLGKKDIQVPEELKSAYDLLMASEKADMDFKRKHDSIDTQYGVVHKRNGKTIFPSRVAMGNYNKAYDRLLSWRSHGPNAWEAQTDSTFDQLRKGNYPWYVWNVHFKKDESRIIKVTYSVPCGFAYRGKYRFFNYLLSTGTGWKGKIEKAVVNVRLHDVDPDEIEKMIPDHNKFDRESDTITWTFADFEPTAQDDIYIQYNPRKRW